jgi:hypothetical protein
MSVSIDLTPGAWAQVSPLARAVMIRAAVEVMTAHANSIGDSFTPDTYQRGFDLVAGDGQVGDWPTNEQGRELVAAVCERVTTYGQGPQIGDLVQLTTDGLWDCARAAISTAAGVTA